MFEVRRSVFEVPRRLKTLWLILAALVVLAVLAWLFARWALAQRRRQLLERYGDADIAERIMKAQLWRGQTAEQLREALGKPADVDQTVLKTKTKEVWKYQPTGKRRYAVKVTLDDGVVVGWEDKS
jgi:hypothetical protein